MINWAAKTKVTKTMCQDMNRKNKYQMPMILPKKIKYNNHQLINILIQQQVILILIPIVLVVFMMNMEIDGITIPIL